MTTTTLEARLAVLEWRIAALETQCSEPATNVVAERAINDFTWTLATSMITVASVILTTMFTAATFVVINSIAIAAG